MWNPGLKSFGHKFFKPFESSDQAIEKIISVVFQLFKLPAFFMSLVIRPFLTPTERRVFLPTSHRPKILLEYRFSLPQAFVSFPVRLIVECYHCSLATAFQLMMFLFNLFTMLTQLIGVFFLAITRCGVPYDNLSIDPREDREAIRSTWQSVVQRQVWKQVGTALLRLVPSLLIYLCLYPFQNTDTHGVLDQDSFSSRFKQSHEDIANDSRTLLQLLVNLHVLGASCCIMLCRLGITQSRILILNFSLKVKQIILNSSNSRDESIQDVSGHAMLYSPVNTNSSDAQKSGLVTSASSQPPEQFILPDSQGELQHQEDSNRWILRGYSQLQQKNTPASNSQPKPGRELLTSFDAAREVNSRLRLGGEKRDSPR